MSSINNSKIHGLDSLRAIAIAMVLMYHYSVVVSHEGTFGIFSDIGWIGVDLFFGLSGYLIGNQIFSAIAQKKKFSLKSFFARRSLRTLPNYYFILAAYFLFPVALSGVKTAPLWQFFTFTQNVSLLPGQTFTHSWSLCIEEQFYLFFPIVTLFVASTKNAIRWGWFTLILAMIMGIVIRAGVWFYFGENKLTWDNYFEHIYYSSFTRFDELIPGVVVAFVKNFHSNFHEKILRLGNRLFVAGSLALVTMVYFLKSYFFSENTGFNIWLITLGFTGLSTTFALLILAATSPHCFFSRLNIPGASKLALWSYAIYLAHKPIYQLAVEPIESFGISPNSFVGVSLIIFAGALGGVLLHYVVEAPFMRLRDKMYPHKNEKVSSNFFMTVKKQGL